MSGMKDSKTLNPHVIFLYTTNNLIVSQPLATVSVTNLLQTSTFGIIIRYFVNITRGLVLPT